MSDWKQARDEQCVGLTEKLNQALHDHRNIWEELEHAEQAIGEILIELAAIVPMAQWEDFMNGQGRHHKNVTTEYLLEVMEATQVFKNRMEERGHSTYYPVFNRRAGQ